MAKLATLLGFIGLGLLLASLAAWPAAAGQEAAELPAQEMMAGDIAQCRALFLAKGCVTCHRNDALGELSGQGSIGPDLSDYQPDPEFTARWLRNPAAVRPGTDMPNLDLAEAEIASLIAFLAAGATEVGASDLAMGPQGCPVTQPQDPPFKPPDADPAQGEGLPGPAASSLGSFEGYFWYGSEALWTQLRRDGMWSELPHNDRGYTQKIFFSRQGYDWRQEPQPALTVSGRRLDVAGPAFEELQATNGYHPDVGPFMLVGVDIPTAGCWQITGHYQGHDLSFVVWLAP